MGGVAPLGRLLGSGRSSDVTLPGQSMAPFYTIGHFNIFQQFRPPSSLLALCLSLVLNRSFLQCPQTRCSPVGVCAIIRPLRLHPMLLCEIARNSLLSSRKDETRARHTGIQVLSDSNNLPRICSLAHVEKSRTDVYSSLGAHQHRHHQTHRAMAA